MKKKKERIPKPIRRRIEDFFDHSENLKEALGLYDQGKRRSIKTMLHCLRVLITKEGLLIKLNDELDLGLGVQLSDFCKSKPGEPLKEEKYVVTLKDYLESKDIIFHGRNFNRSQFIWEIASQNSVHEDDGLDPAFVAGELLIINGQNSINLSIANIARTIDSVCDLATSNLKYLIEQAGRAD